MRIKIVDGQQFEVPEEPHDREAEHKFAVVEPVAAKILGLDFGAAETRLLVHLSSEEAIRAALDVPFPLDLGYATGLLDMISRKSGPDYYYRSNRVVQGSYTGRLSKFIDEAHYLKPVNARPSKVHRLKGVRP